MSNLQPFQQSNGLAPASSMRLPAATRRTLSQMQQNVIVKAAQVQAQAAVGREAMFAVADLTELEYQLASVCPMAAPRLNAIGNITAMSIAHTLSGFRG